MADHIQRHGGVPETIRLITQVSFLVRLVAVLLAMVASLGQTLGAVDIIAVVVLGGVSFACLMNTRWLTVVRRHPMIALIDALVVAVVVSLDGRDTPLILAALTTALLVGLWVDVKAGLITVVPIVAVYLLGLTRDPLAADQVFLQVLVVPFVYLTLWVLGLAIAHSVRRQERSDAIVRDAIATAAAIEERTKLARELHDSLAKSLQGMSLTATAIPTLIERDPGRARAAADELRQMGVTAVAQVRRVMTGLRERTSELPLATSVLHLAQVWESEQGRSLTLRIDDVDTTDETVRYELLSVLEESLANVARHAGPCEVEVSLRADGADLVLTVVDRGKGVDPLTVEAAARAGHHGVAGLHERMARIGGQCEWSSEPGRGTSAQFRVSRLGLIEQNGMVAR